MYMFTLFISVSVPFDGVFLFEYIEDKTYGRY